jgi:hypothetical protein
MSAFHLYFFFSGFSLGLLFGPVILHLLKAWFSSPHARP